MIKTYVNQEGYRIRASEKAYNRIYKKMGFVPVAEEKLKREKPVAEPQVEEGQISDTTGSVAQKVRRSGRRQKVVEKNSNNVVTEQEETAADRSAGGEDDSSGDAGNQG